MTSVTADAGAGVLLPPRSLDGRWWWNGRSWRPVVSSTPWWLSPYRSPRRWARWLLGALIFELAGALPWLVPGLQVPLQRLASTPFPFHPTDPASDAQLAVVVLAISWNVVFFLGTPALAAAWTCRCVRNLGALGGRSLRWSPGWAACGWLIPLANLAVPYFVLRQVWTVSAAGKRPPKALHLWEAAWVLQAVLLTLGSRLPISEAFLTAIGFGTIALSALLLIALVRRVTKLQEGRLAAPVTDVPPAPWARPYVSAELRAGLAVMAVGLTGLAALVTLVTGALLTILLGIPTFPFGAQQAAAPAWAVLTEDAWVLGTALFVLAGAVLSPIALALWAHRAYRNAAVLGPGSRSPLWSPGWAAASWFVPVANLALPYLVVKEMWRDCRPTADRGALTVAVWWSISLGAVLLKVVAISLYLTRDQTLESLGNLASGAADAALIVAALLTILGIVTITRCQRSLPHHDQATLPTA